jgi:hypothetical protein
MCWMYFHTYLAGGLTHRGIFPDRSPAVADEAVERIFSQLAPLLGRQTFYQIHPSYSASRPEVSFPMFAVFPPLSP